MGEMLQTGNPLGEESAGWGEAWGLERGLGAGGSKAARLELHIDLLMCSLDLERVTSFI